MVDAFKCRNCGEIVERPQNCPSCGERAMQPTQVPESALHGATADEQSADDGADERPSDESEATRGNDTAGSNRRDSDGGGGLLSRLKSLF